MHQFICFLPTSNLEFCYRFCNIIIFFNHIFQKLINTQFIWWILRYNFCVYIQNLIDRFKKYFFPFIFITNLEMLKIIRFIILYKILLMIIRLFFGVSFWGIKIGVLYFMSMIIDLINNRNLREIKSKAF